MDNKTSKWVRENLPQLVARGPDIASRVINQAIQETRIKRFWVVLIAILVPAIIVNVFHAALKAATRGTISRSALISTALIASAVAAAKLTQTILRQAIERLACSYPE